jgi:hypothetical protein
MVMVIASALPGSTTDPLSIPAFRARLETYRKIDAPRLQGNGRMRFLAFDVYEARLWTPADFRPARYGEAAFALELNYLRSLSTEVLVEASVREMRRLGSWTAQREAAWTAALKTAFPPVSPGDRITGVHRPGVGARFFFNGRLQAVVDDADFARAFFGIWLSPNTSEPRLRSALLQGDAS